MPANTPKGFPYPLPSEPVAEGAQAIRNLAEAIDAKIGGKIASTLLAAPANNFDLTSIPATYATLQLFLYLRGTDAGAAVTVHVQFNGDTGANYDYVVNDLLANPVTSVNGFNGANSRIGRAPAGGAPAGAFGQTVAELFNYTGTVGSKNLFARTVSKEAAGTAARGEMNPCNWHPGTAAAINRITVFPSSGQWAIGSWAFLAGILA